MKEQTLDCVVRSVTEGGVVYRAFAERIITSVDVEIEATHSGNGAFRATIGLPPDEQPKIGDRMRVTVSPVDPTRPPRAG